MKVQERAVALLMFISTAGVLAGCASSSNQSGPLVPSEQRSVSGLKTSSVAVSGQAIKEAVPLKPDELNIPGRVGHVPNVDKNPSAPASEFVAFRERLKHSKSLKNVSAGHETWGTFLSSQSSLAGVYAQQTIYLQKPTFYGGSQWLYAPTMKVASANPIEVTTIYPSFGEAVSIGAYDFRTGNFQARIWTTDSNAVNDYMPVFGDGRRYYRVETVFSGTDGAWHALMFNNTYGRWDEFYSAPASAGISPDISWSMFETQYPSGTTCATLPDAIISLGISVFDTSIGWWRTTSSSDVAPGTESGYVSTDQSHCFGPPAPGYNPTFTSYPNAWQVTNQ